MCPECLDHVARFLGLHTIIIVPLVDPDKGHLSIIGAFEPGVKRRKVCATPVPLLALFGQFTRARRQTLQRVHTQQGVQT